MPTARCHYTLCHKTPTFCFPGSVRTHIIRRGNETTALSENTSGIFLPQLLQEGWLSPTERASSG